MRLTETQLRRIIRQEYRLLKESLYLDDESTGDFYWVIAEEAANAWDNGVTKIADFIKIVLPIGLKAGYSKKQITNDARKAWKLEKEARSDFY